MSGDAFTGLRPVVKRQLGGELSRKTLRIVLPASTGEGPDDLPLPVVEPPRRIPIPKTIAQKGFALVPVSPALLELLPEGIFLTPGWIYIGSNPSLELPVFTALVLHVDGISKTHAAVTEFNGTPFVSDLGSTNGTRLFRDQKALEVVGEPVELQPGDILWIGSVFFTVVQS